MARNKIGESQLTMMNSNRELSLIDRHLTDIPSLNFRHLISINLHGNNISTIRGLDQFSDTLRFLDLSSNRLASMSGLDNLHELVYLNLSSNRLVSVSNITKLRNLRYINLSYNRITSLGGFRQLALSNMNISALERVDLQANSLKSVDLVITAFCEFANLRELNLKKDDATNPVCSIGNYRQRVMASLSHLSVLDGCDRFGNPIIDSGWLQQEDIMSDLVLSLIDNTVLDDFDQPVKMSATSKPPVGTKSNAVNTPHVDAVLARIRKVQMREMEKFGDITEAEEEEEEVAQVTHSHRKGADGGEEKNEKRQIAEEEHMQQQLVMELYEKRLKELEGEISRIKTSVGQQSETAIQNSKIHDVGIQTTKDHRRPNAHSARQDSEVESRRDAAKTFSELIRQIEQERERRYKAEMAAKRLVESVKVMEDRIRNLQDLTTTVEVEHSARVKAEEEIKRLSGQLQEANLRLPDLEILLQKNNAETSRLKSDLDEAVRKQLTAEKKILECDNEANRYHQQAIDLERRLNDVQATLAAREAEHRRENQGRDCNERVATLETLWKERLQTEKQRNEELSTRYRQLEDEFRDALRIEANRYNTLEEELKRVVDEERKSKNTCQSLEQRLQQHQQASSHLTGLVKGLKSKLSENEKEHVGKMADLEARVMKSEKELLESRKQAQAAELLRQEKVKLVAELQALQSVAEGLRSERKHWGEELAKQGAQLSADRGRLETRIEALTVEVGTLRKELDKEVETVKIKTTIIDDQLDTIRKLKDALQERERELKDARNECLELQRQVDERDQELKESADALETSDRRASELKKRANDLQQQLANEKTMRICEADKWRDRVQNIGDLETRVIELQKNSQEREKQLLDEKTKLSCELEATRERLKVLDDRFREQLDLTQVDHARQLERVRNEAQNEVAKAQLRVHQVEDEMRSLLAETENQKKSMEQRVKQLQNGLNQLVGGIADFSNSNLNNSK